MKIKMSLLVVAAIVSFSALGAPPLGAQYNTCLSQLAAWYKTKSPSEFDKYFVNTSNGGVGFISEDDQHHFSLNYLDKNLRSDTEVSEMPEYALHQQDLISPPTPTTTAIINSKEPIQVQWNCQPRITNARDNKSKVKEPISNKALQLASVRKIAQSTITQAFVGALGAGAKPDELKSCYSEISDSDLKAAIDAAVKIQHATQAGRAGSTL
jgi:hypothetical protein